MIKVKKALAVSAYDILVNNISIGRKGTRKEAVQVAKDMAQKAGVEYLGVERSPKKIKEATLFQSKYKAIPRGWKWGEC